MAETKPGARSLLTAAWAIYLAATTAVLTLGLPPLPGTVTPFDRAFFSQSKEGPQSMVALPDNWRTDAGRPALAGHYHVRFDYPGDSGRWAMFIPTYTGTLGIRINGLELQPLGALRQCGYIPRRVVSRMTRARIACDDFIERPTCPDGTRLL